MYNSTLTVKIESVAPYSTERKGKKDEGIFITASMQVGNGKVFDDVDFGKNRNGLQTILKGELPIKGTGVRLAFIRKKDTTLNVEGLKNIPVTVDDIFTGATKNGTIPVKLKLNVKQLDEETAGKFANALNDDIEITIVSTQNEMEMDAAPSKPKKETKVHPIDGKPEKKRTSGKMTLDVNK